ncbi:MAG: ATP-binding protein [Vicinamibacterales bacterium]
MTTGAAPVVPVGVPNATGLSSLSGAHESRDIVAAVADVLARAWKADAVVVWLPASDEGAVTADDLSLAGHGLRACLPADLVAPMRERRVDRWLAARGLVACRVVDVAPAHLGRIVCAWAGENRVPPHIDHVLGLLAAHIALLIERRHLEERLAAANAARLEAEDQILRTRRVRALGEMASGVVHDFNNCLTSILGFTELALGPLDEGDAFYNDLNSIRTSALDAAALVRRLQSLGRRNRDTDEREVVDLRDVARMMPTLARPRWMHLSQCHGVSFDVAVDARPVPAVHVVVAEIRELLLNLLFNAVDAMPSGGRITITTRQAESGWAEISVADQGEGMSDEVQRRVFQPFFSTKGDHGSGLGLSVCQTIASRHGATLEVVSVPGQGSTFTLALPPASPGLIAAVEPHQAGATRPRAVQRVLLVDDQEEVRDSVGEMLRALGHDVTVVDRGDAAVALAGRQRLDVVITDLGMPGMNGLDVAQRFRVLAPRVPVVLLTGWGLDSDAPRPPNVAFVLGKPVTMKSLGDALEACAAAPAPIDERSEKCS